MRHSGESDHASLFLALDQGGHSSRAIVYDSGGRILVRARAEVADSAPQRGWVEQDAEALAQSLAGVLVETAALLGPDIHRLRVAGLATQRSNVVCWDRASGMPLTPAISWQDRRADAWIHQFDAYSDKVHRITGLYLNAHYGAGKLRWCLDHSGDVQEALSEGRLACGPLASFLAWRLLVNRPLCVDPANAARTLLWNLERKNWDSYLLDLFGIPRRLLPDCVETIRPFGTLNVGAAGVPMRCVTGDQAAALFVQGQPDTGTAFVNIGTGAFVQRATGNAALHLSGLLSGIALYGGGRAIYTLEGTVNGAGTALDWLLAREPQDMDFGKLDTWLADDVELPLFLNGVAGLGSPWWVADFPSRFIGDHAARERMLAVIESIVFLITVNLERMAGISPPLRRAVITGGFAALDGLCQRIADLNQVTVQRPAEYEATARGLAWLLTESDPDWTLEDVRHFQPRDNRALATRYQHWKQAMEAALQDSSGTNI